MKHFYMAVCILLGSVWAQAATTPSDLSPWRVDWELSLGSTTLIDVESYSMRDRGPGFSFGVTHCYPLSPEFRLRSGISFLLLGFDRTIYNPYPYAMDMRVDMFTLSTRLSAGFDYNFRVLPNGKSYHYVGVGAFGDIIHRAEAIVNLNYISEHVYYNEDLMDSFLEVVPGIQIHLGRQYKRGKIEFRYWEDIRSFDVPNTPLGRQRRAFFGINGGLYLYNSAKK